MGRIGIWWADRSLPAKGWTIASLPVLVALAAEAILPRPAPFARPALALAAVAASAHLFQRSVTRRVERNRVNAYRLVQGLPLRDPPSGRDAIGEAGQALVVAGWLRAEREAALDRSRAELRRSNEDLERFAYAASHDLQEPLRMIASYVRLLRRELGTPPSEDAERAMTFIEDGAVRMKQLIDGLLAYSRAGTAPLERAPTDLNEVLATCLRDLEVAIREAQASVTADPLPVVEGDRAQLRQLLQNLLSNAVKFRNGRPPAIHVGARRDGDRWILSVSDDGIGIPPEFHERIMGMFQRLHTAAEYPGTGIGLAICQRVVERHGGELWVESSPGRGSTFHVALPAATGGGADG
jgi:light-regulated signal transduction histidine kinase (bacteriophytochrome)